ncbi:hypothetical protein FANTH_4031 [Fusarium anthophilum]|uniref:Helicase n=1 Tax=Fusarium anthophilum TaxID=48485 RepID=A0A8H4ZQZ5_9HYPO|nr:hypothetical protein FANTH_4031 [Fusarium anthophilum]
MALFPSLVAQNQFVDVTGMNQVIPSTLYSNACFNTRNSPMYDPWGPISAGYCTSTPVGFHSPGLLFDGNVFERYPVNGIPHLAINQRPEGLQLPGAFNYTDNRASLSLTPVTENADSAWEALAVEDIIKKSDSLHDSSHDGLEEAAQPKFIKTPLTRQKQALTFMLKREEGRGFSDEEPVRCNGGIIADPMGFGKTVTMIALAARDLEDGKGEHSIGEEGSRNIQATLVVVPLSRNWKEELAKHVLGGHLTHDVHLREDPLTGQLENLNVVLTTYDQIRTEWKAKNGKTRSMFSVSWRRIVLDEAHRIRNSDSQEYKAIRELQSWSRWAVTGTPIQNNLEDLGSLFSFIRVPPYSDQNRFEEDISNTWKSGDSLKALRKLKRLIKNLVLRRPIKTLGLPTRKDIQLEVEFTAEERALYDRIAHRLDYPEKIAGNNVNSDRKGKFREFTELRQVCNLGLNYKIMQAKVSDVSKPHKGPSLSSKVNALIEDIQAFSPREKCLVFSSWRTTLDSIKAGLEHLSIPSVRFDGTVPQEERQGILDQFKATNGGRVMLLTLACGAEGLNLTEATRVYLVEPNWNPSVEEQALSRAWRIGQKHPVTTVRLLMRDSIEAVVVERQKLKRKLTHLLFPSRDNEIALEDRAALEELHPVVS